MHGTIPGRRKAITSAIILATMSIAAAQNAAAAQDDPEVEEVVVTGSYIRGTPIDAPSPVQVVNRDSIEAQGAAVIWDVIKNLEINSGSITNPGSGDNSQVAGSANVNLRNLGENSTLTLVNGKRQVSAAATTRSGGEFVDLNSIPLVMTERVEILTDGGSALYGADAVAGAVNVIMRTDFEGLEVYGDLQGIAEAGDLFDKTASAIWGWATEDGDTHFVLSGERFERDPVSVQYGNYFDENSEFLGSASSAGTLISSPFFGGKVNPAYVNQGITNANIADGGSANTVYTDPGCYTGKSVDGTPFQIGRLREERGARAGTCWEDNSEWNFISQETTRDSFAGAFNHTFENEAEFYSFFQYSDSTTIRADDGYNSSRGPTVFLGQPGAHAGARGQVMNLGYYAPMAGLTRPTSIPNAPVAQTNGGPNVAFYTNVKTGVPRTGADNNETWNQTLGAQTGLRGELEIGAKTYNYDVSYSWSGASMEQTYKTFNRQRAELAANGLGGPSCTPNGRPDFDFGRQPGTDAWDTYYAGLTQTFFPGFVFTTRESLSYALTSNNQGQGGCMFYNPFLSALTNPNVANSAELMDWMNQTVNVVDKRNKLAVVDAVISGELFEMGGGMAQFAAGGQYRDQNNKSRASLLNLPGIPNAILSYDAAGKPNATHYVSNNFDCSLCAFNYDHDRTVKAVFGELSLPVWENVETQIALRYEDYGGKIGSEVSPKFAISWRPIEELLVRGSFSQSFRAPNIGIIYAGLESSSVTFRDPISSQRVRAGLVPPTNVNAEAETTYTLGGPAPDVGNEYADTFSSGFMWTPGGALEGFSVGADVWRFEVEDRVMPQPPISALQPEIDAFVTAAANPANYVLNSTVSSSAASPYTACNPTTLATQFGVDSKQRLDCVVDPRKYIVPGIQRAANDNTANLITLTLGAINAGVIVADGIDLKLAYRWDNDWGRFGISSDYTHVRQYKLVDVPGLELGLKDIGVFDAAGTTGDDNLVRSLPDNKGNIMLSWNRDVHGVTVTNRHIGSYRDLSYQTTYENGNDFVRSMVRKSVDSYQTWDLQYRYTHDWANELYGTTMLTFGVLDAFNEELPYRESSSLNYDASVFDGRGRRIYARVLLQL
ncbi:MAG: TonB-dependent receptor [Gammaproteobacteria bacterium]|nr:TonB-dependent receptor [Gammaproteobacteria bacterium]